MDHSAGVDVVLETDFMIPAGVRLDLFHGTSRLSDEVVSQLVKSAGATDEEPYGEGTDHRSANNGLLCHSRGELPREVGYVRLNSSKYKEWQVLTYAEGRDNTLLRKEKELYECWEGDRGHGGVRKVKSGPPKDGETSVTAGFDEDADGKDDQRQKEFSDAEDDNMNLAEDSVDMLEMTYISVIQEIEAGIVSGNRGDDEDLYEHIPNEMDLADYAHELAFLPDLTELSSTTLAIRDRTPWVSPIVTVLKKKGVDIRLCIDYKRVNADTTIMEYAMPLVDDLITDMEAYLWFCSLDAASGFWAVMMTERDQKASAFVCALGDFEWRRMPLSFKNAPIIYQRMVDNALCWFGQPKGGWKEYSERMRPPEEDSERTKTGVTEGLTKPRSNFEPIESSHQFWTLSQN
ncbi:hypothetical protein PHMEG_00016463 [Phytophthora megakarya]|uniref:Reverse transcriptase domain-containing protein n=1 Tax=Phytophthora megakarya TaxID=4795 RepID=A0A225VYZ5_9STRA|nr:hypothetical protein PHMEG_00016463 [Phytophthora megakarya]